jgi:hypothetical protein
LNSSRRSRCTEERRQAHPNEEVDEQTDATPRRLLAGSVVVVVVVASINCKHVFSPFFPLLIPAESFNFGFAIRLADREGRVALGKIHAYGQELEQSLYMYNKIQRKAC